jgi:hypothetical protein
MQFWGEGDSRRLLEVGVEDVLEFIGEFRKVQPKTSAPVTSLSMKVYKVCGDVLPTEPHARTVAILLSRL